MKHILAIILFSSAFAFAAVTSDSDLTGIPSSAVASAVNDTGVVSQNLTPSSSQTIGTVATPFPNAHFTAQHTYGTLFLANDEGSISYQASQPQGGDPDVAFRASYPGVLGIWTEGSSASDATATSALNINTGNKTGGTGDSGKINIQTGTSLGGTRGMIDLNGLVVRTVTTSSRPTCSSTYRGAVHYTQSADGTSDFKQICNKVDTANNYAWVDESSSGAMVRWSGAVDTNCSSDPCTITVQYPASAITSITGSGGDYLMNIPSGKCSAKAICNIESQNGSVNLFCSSWRHHASSSTTALKFYCVDAAASQAAGRLAWRCECPK